MFAFLRDKCTWLLRSLTFQTASGYNLIELSHLKSRLLCAQKFTHKISTDGVEQERLNGWLAPYDWWIIIWFGFYTDVSWSYST